MNASPYLFLSCPLEYSSVCSKAMFINPSRHERIPGNSMAIPRLLIEKMCMSAMSCQQKILQAQNNFFIETQNHKDACCLLGVYLVVSFDLF